MFCGGRCGCISSRHLKYFPWKITNFLFLTDEYFEEAFFCFISIYIVNLLTLISLRFEKWKFNENLVKNIALFWGLESRCVHRLYTMEDFLWRKKNPTTVVRYKLPYDFVTLLLPSQNCVLWCFGISNTCVVLRLYTVWRAVVRYASGVGCAGAAAELSCAVNYAAGPPTVSS